METCPLPNDLSAPHQARRFAAVTIEQWGLDVPEDLPLALSELVTNAIFHGQPPIAVSIGIDPPFVLVEVSDAGSWDPPPGCAPLTDPLVPGGKGLHIVATVASSWGVTQDAEGSGHRSWFRMPHR